MNNSSNDQIPELNAISEDSSNSGSGSNQNVGFLVPLDPQIVGECSSPLPELFKTQTINVLDAEFLRSWLHGKSHHTQRAYLRIGLELLSSLNPTQIKDASLSFLQTFIECNSGNSQETKRQRSAILKSLFSFGIRTGYLTASPAVFLPQIKAQSKLTERYLTEEEMMRMITKTENLRDQTILKVLYSGGLRVSELTGLNWGDLQEREGGSGQIKILGKGDKVRVVVLSLGVFQQLLKLRPDGFQNWDPVFLSREQGRISVGAVELLVDRARLRAGIPRKVSPHWLRHGHASHALDRGAPIHLVQSTLGHASVATTGKYLHSRPQESSGKYLGV